jgi:dolichol-phosphate mannosyltransferase
MQSTLRAAAQPAISVVVPVCNEADNVAPLVREIVQALGPVPHEIIYVDDGSTDGTVEVARRVRAEGVPQLRLLRHSFRSGQSAAVASGIRAARAEWIATLDGDGQNDPADLPALMAARQQHPAVRLIMGNRVARRDTAMRRLQSRVANGVRSRAARRWHAGHGLRHQASASRDLHRTLPYFDHMHRFLPALFQRAGAR